MKAKQERAFPSHGGMWPVQATAKGRTVLGKSRVEGHEQ